MYNLDRWDEVPSTTRKKVKRMTLNTITLFTKRKEDFEALKRVLYESLFVKTETNKFSSTLHVHHYEMLTENFKYTVVVYESRYEGYETK